MHKISLFIFSFFFAVSAFTQNVIWNFGTGTTPNENPSTNTANNVNVSALTRGNISGVSTGFADATSPSSGYSGASGEYNAPIAAKSGSLSTAANGSVYFQFTLTPDANYTVQLSGISFGTRSTSSGPIAYTLRSSLDGYGNDVATGAMTANGSWALKSNSGITTTSGIGAPVTFRIYGYDGSGTSNNWRIDDLALTLVSTSTSSSPAITLTTTNFNGAFGNVNVGASSAAASFSVSGSNLTDNITITPPAGGFEIRTGSAAFSTATVTLARSSGSVAPTTIDVRFTPTATGAKSGDISITSTGATSKTVAVSGTGVQPTKLAITAITPATPTVNNSFSVTVQSQDANGTATNVLAGTSFSLSVSNGTGVLGGTVSGTIAAGTNQAVVSGITYNKAENNVVLTATQTSGDALAASSSAAFNVQDAATQLAFVGFPASGTANSSLASFTVEARRADNSVDGSYAGNITLGIARGNGNITGTLTKAAVAGIVTFNDIKLDAAGNYTLNAMASGLTTATSNIITIGAAGVVPVAGELLINQMSPGYGAATDEYVELVNVTDKNLDLSTVALRYQSAGGTGTINAPLAGTLAPHGYWLLSTNTAVTVGQTIALARDGSFSAGFAAGSGQIAIVQISSGAIIDGVGYGTITNGTYTEGTPAATPPTNGGIRRVFEGTDNNTNSTDFTTVTNANIDLRNSSSRLANGGANLAAGTYDRLYLTGNATLIGPVAISNRLILGSNGVLTTTSSNILKLAATATVSGGSSASYIDGPVTVASSSTSAKLLPVGKAGTYKPVTITPTTASASEYMAEYFAAAPPSASLESRINAYLTSEYWQIDRTAGTAPATVSLNYNSGGATWSNGMNPTVSDVISIVHLRSSNNTWTQEYGTNVPSNATSAMLTTNVINDFSPFTFGYGSSVALPVVISSFTATKTNTGNVLNWSVASETNFSRYEIERSNGTINDFKTVGKISAANAGNYHFTDALVKGYNYYRLKLIDKDEKVSYSKTMLIINDAKGFEITNLYPTITRGIVRLESYAAAPTNVTIRIVNWLGQVVSSQSAIFSQATTTNIDVIRLTKGNYLMQVIAAGDTKTFKFVKE